MRELWQGWIAAWRGMEAHARRRGWKVAPLEIAPPASEERVAAVEAAHGLTVPKQLRDLLTGYSSAIQFGWRIPSHLLQVGEFSSLTSGGLRGTIWDLAHIDKYAIANFRNWRRHLGDHSGPSEEPNSPDMWEHQFPFADLANGDMLTIDLRSDTTQPIRYFSHELEGLHGAAIAPDFHAFVTEYSALGCAGGTHDDWFAFCPMRPDGHRYLTAQGHAGREWRAFVARDLGEWVPDEPPPVLLAQTEVDRALLAAAKADDLQGVAAALEDGANPDCCLEGTWNDEHVTAFTHAVRHDNLALMALLVERGATIDTRRLPLGEAVATGTLETVQWLIGRGARANGWKGDRHWPLHRLIVQRKADAPGGDEAYFAILDALLAAGADPNAPWDNRTTMLMHAGPETARRLLAAGADPHRTDYEGGSALHHANSAELARILVQHGADVNALSKPHERIGNAPMPILKTPLQDVLNPYRQAEGVAAALLELGADPRLPDSRGLNALFYCGRADDVALLRRHGLTLDQRTPDGGTLLHHLCVYHQGAVARDERTVALIRYLVENGVDINARDGAGQTVLHLIAKSEHGGDDDVALMLELGADKSVVDRKGRRPSAVVPRSKPGLRAALTWGL
jgi:ankyrin repeat protein